MSRGLDHIVHAVRDLDAAAALYRNLGFTVGARNTHPWGTQNHVVQTPGFFIELLAIADPSRIVPAEPKSFSFGAFNRDFLARGEGFSMLVLEGRGDDDARDFRDAGIGDFAPFYFEREARRPDGTPIRVAFTLAFARDAAMPQIGFFTCQHHHPENFWNPEFQRHDNGTQSAAGTVLVAQHPGAHAPFLAAFSGGAIEQREAAVIARTPRGDIGVMDAPAFAAAFDVDAPPSGAARLAALRLLVADLQKTAASLRKGKVIYAAAPNRLVVPAGSALGAMIVFEQAPITRAIRQR